MTSTHSHGYSMEIVTLVIMKTTTIMVTVIVFCFRCLLLQPPASARVATAWRRPRRLAPKLAWIEMNSEVVGIDSGNILGRSRVL